MFVLGNKQFASRNNASGSGLPMTCGGVHVLFDIGMEDGPYGAGGVGLEFSGGKLRGSYVSS
jgi:hypothetical protein